MIASHYAEPLKCAFARGSAVRSAPDDNADEICTLEAGAPFWMLDENLGWAWGYAGSERLVGYVRADSLGAAG